MYTMINKMIAVLAYIRNTSILHSNHFVHHCIVEEASIPILLVNWLSQWCGCASVPLYFIHPWTYPLSSQDSLAWQEQDKSHFLDSWQLQSCLLCPVCREKCTDSSFHSCVYNCTSHHHFEENILLILQQIQNWNLRDKPECQDWFSRIKDVFNVQQFGKVRVFILLKKIKEGRFT